MTIPSLLVVNAGSTSLKCARVSQDNKILNQIQLYWDRLPGKVLWEENKKRSQELFLPSIEEGQKQLFNAVHTAGWNLQGVAHRIVHGGKQFTTIHFLTDETLIELDKLSELAPLHNPANLNAIRLAKNYFNGVPHLGVFDTAFHTTISQAASLYPVPLQWEEWGIRRYGFHGINHNYCGRIAYEMLGPNCKRVITCHLGGGSSLCAQLNGKSIETTMGFSPLEGLMMSTRSGNIDPEALIFLMHKTGIKPEELSHILNFESGLLAITKTTGSFKKIEEEAAKGSASCKLAYQMYIHRLKLFIGSMVAALGSVQCLVFTAGIGEHSSNLRKEIAESQPYLGICIDDKKNQSSSDEPHLISTPDSKIDVLVIPAGEEVEMARQCWPILLKF